MTFIFLTEEDDDAEDDDLKLSYESNKKFRLLNQESPSTILIRVDGGGKVFANIIIQSAEI